MDFLRCCWCLPTIPISRLSAALILSRRTLHKRGARVWSPANCSYHTEIMPGYSAMVRAEHRRTVWRLALFVVCALRRLVALHPALTRHKAQKHELTPQTSGKSTPSRTCSLHTSMLLNGIKQTSAFSPIQLDSRK